jgi:hypothetical protein
MFQTSEYSLRIYAPDFHSELYRVRMTVDAVKDIRQILVSEAKSWEMRVRPGLTGTDVHGDRNLE